MFLTGIVTAYGVGSGITTAEGKTMPHRLSLDLSGGIVGTWVSPNIEHENFRFLQNGDMVTQDGKRYVYRIEDNRIVLIGQEGDQIVWEVSIKGNTMTIEYMSSPGRFKNGKLTPSEFGVQGAQYVKKS